MDGGDFADLCIRDVNLRALWKRLTRKQVKEIKKLLPTDYNHEKLVAGEFFQLEDAIKIRNDIVKNNPHDSKANYRLGEIVTGEKYANTRNPESPDKTDEAGGGITAWGYGLIRALGGGPH